MTNAVHPPVSAGALEGELKAATGGAGGGTTDETGEQSAGGGEFGFSSLTAADRLKMAVMTPLTIFCFLFMVYGILAGHAAMPGNGVILLFVYFFVVWVLGMAEGLQIALLELDAEEMRTIRFFVPNAWRCHERTLGDGMSQWLAGRQVLVIFSVFVVAQITTFPTLEKFPFTDKPLPNAFSDIFISTGLPGALVTVAIGQLAPQLIATSHPLWLLRSLGAWPIVAAALALQRLGITHFAWAVVVGMDRLLKRDSKKKEGDVDNTDAGSDADAAAAAPNDDALEEQGGVKAVGFALDEERDVALERGWVGGVKYVLMTLISLFCALVIFYGLGGGYSRFPGSAGFHVIFFLVVVSVLGYLEGLQVALLRFPLVHDPEDFRKSHPKVYWQYEATHGTAAMNNFLCGRQVFVIFTVFLVAQLSSFPELKWLPLVGEVPSWFRVVVFDTGLPGALIVVAIGQLVPQLIGEIHPVAMLSAPLASWVVRAALALQQIGLTHFAVLAALLAKRGLSLDSSNTSAHTDDEEQLAANAHHGGHHGARRRGRYAKLVAAQTREDMARFASHFLALHDEGLLGVETGGGIDTPHLGPASPTQQLGDGGVRAMSPMTLASMSPAAAQATLMLQEDALDTVSANQTFGTGCEPEGARALPDEWMLPPQADPEAGHVPAEAAGAPKPKPFVQYPSPQRIARMYKERYGAVPRFLLPPDHDKHVPPHIVAHEMLLKLNAFGVTPHAHVGGGSAAAAAAPDATKKSSYRSN